MDYALTEVHKSNANAASIAEKAIFNKSNVIGSIGFSPLFLIYWYLEEGPYSAAPCRNFRHSGIFKN